MPKIIHYRNKCIGCGVCFELQPELWRMSKKDGKATLIKAVKKKDVHIADVNETNYSACMSVAQQCPVNIIKV